jgi:hypothetical protein
MKVNNIYKGGRCRIYPKLHPEDHLHVITYYSTSHLRILDATKRVKLVRTSSPTASSTSSIAIMPYNNTPIVPPKEYTGAVSLPCKLLNIPPTCPVHFTESLVIQCHITFLSLLYLTASTFSHINRVPIKFVMLSSLLPPFIKCDPSISYQISNLPIIVARRYKLCYSPAHPCPTAILEILTFFHDVHTVISSIICAAESLSSYSVYQHI